jgi:hypothetical protein
MYKLLKLEDTYTKEKMGEALVRIQDGAFIPFDPANTDYQAYLKWLEEGGQPLPADEVSGE